MGKRRKKKPYLAAAGMVLGLAVAAAVFTKETKVGTTELASTEQAYRGPLDDCLQSAYIYFQSDDIVSECTFNYVHFYSAKAPKKPSRRPSQVRIGSFNLYHLGDSLSPMKNLPLMAEIMNQWDLVGAQEMMPLPGMWSASNTRIFEMIAKKNVKFRDGWTVVTPGYLDLLRALQKLDPNWSLIMQPIPEGQGSTGEMAGFYYRASVIRPKEWDYCDSQKSYDLVSDDEAGNYGCLIHVSEKQAKLISRRAFATYFQVGNFDFVALSAHVRFNPDKDPANRLAQGAELCSRYEGSKRCAIAQTDVGRYYEILTTADQVEDMKQLSGDRDIIYMGDFNLEIKKSTLPFWAAALKSAPDRSPWQTSPTTLSYQSQALRSNYDHFVLDRRLTGECDTASVKSFNFMAASPQNKNPILRKIYDKLDPDSHENLLNMQRSLAQHLWISPSKANSEPRPLNDREREALIKSYAGAAARMKTNPYRAGIELLSDHIPVEMTCRVDRPDDD